MGSDLVRLKAEDRGGVTTYTTRLWHNVRGSTNFGGNVALSLAVLHATTAIQLHDPRHSRDDKEG